MIRRDLPVEWLQNPPDFLSQIIGDPELHPEIRDNAITVYYRGKAVIKDLILRDGLVSACIHYKYVPISRPGSDYVSLVHGRSGFQFAQPLAPLPLERLDTRTLCEYKRMMRSDGRNEECRIIHAITCRPGNIIVDQEVKFQDSDARISDKIDICSYDTHLECLAMVEVKGIHDPRLLPGQNEIPEVIDQLANYRIRLVQHCACLAETFTRVVKMKRAIGLRDRLVGVPEEVELELLAKPVLVIGNCTAVEAEAILRGEGKWEPLLHALRGVASGLIVCGQAGARLRLDNGPQRVTFDTATHPPAV